MAEEKKTGGIGLPERMTRYPGFFNRLIKKSLLHKISRGDFYAHF